MQSQRRSARSRASCSLISDHRLDSSSIEEKETEQTSTCKLERPGIAHLEVSKLSDQAVPLTSTSTSDHLEQASEEQKEEYKHVPQKEENNDDEAMLILAVAAAANGSGGGQDIGDGDGDEDDGYSDDEDEDADGDLDCEVDLDSSHLSYCRGISKTPLAVPMVAEMTQQSVTRNDAKAITETRLRRLKELSKRPELALSKDQKDEKKRIIRLEKNRRAAAMSRRKKKMYVKNLEEKTQLMARHLAIIEMENAHLRALLNATQQANAAAVAAAGHGIHGPPPPPVPPPAAQGMPRIGNVGAFSSSSSSYAPNGNSSVNTNENRSCSRGPTSSSPRAASLEVREPPSKRRKLSLTTSVSEQRQCKDESGDNMSVLEPLPVQNHVKFAPYATAPAHLMLPPHLMLREGRSLAMSTQRASATYGTGDDDEDGDDDDDDDDEVQVIEHIHGAGSNNNNNAHSNNTNLNMNMHMHMHMNMNMNMNMRQGPLKRHERCSSHDDEIPPEVIVPLSTEFISMLDADEDLMDESMDDITFPQNDGTENIYL